MFVKVNGKKISPSPSRSIGKGGEADVYDIGGGLALKLWKPPGHADFAGDAAQEGAARLRIAEQQRKLPDFPRTLPSSVIAPVDAALDGKSIAGYTMRLVSGAEPILRLSERSFRQRGFPAASVVSVFRNLHAAVTLVHRAGVVIGDFNDLNVLVAGHTPYLIDADSFQYGPYRCPVFTERFVDPLLCDRTAPRPVLTRPHTADSDWYAFHSMFFRSLLLADPYGGVYRPRSGKAIPHPARPLHGISVLHADIVYPKPAERPDILPDDLLQRFHDVFEKGRRGELPRPLLDGLRFTTCATCGLEHARAGCPRCVTAPAVAVKSVVRVHGTVTSTRIATTRGVFLAATLANGLLLWLAHEDGAYRREDGSVVLVGPLDPRLKVRLQGSATLLGKGDQVVTLRPGAAPVRTTVDGTAFDTNGRHRYTVRDGVLLRDGALGDERIGDVLAEQTAIWAGPAFGFGFYRAGELFVPFLFDGEGHGLLDRLAVPRPRGELIRVSAAFTKERVFVSMTALEAGREVHRLVALKRDGTVEATADGEDLAPGFCAVGRSLLAPTDEGVARYDVDLASGRLVRTREFPDTEPFVDRESRLLAADDGLYVVDRKEIRRLKIY